MPVPARRVLGMVPGLLALSVYLVLVATPEPGADADPGPAQEIVISYDGR
jgi:hypothetical protein